MSWNCLPGFYSSTFLQLVNVIKKLNLELSFETQPLQVFSSIFLYCLSRKTLDRFFIFLHHCYYTYKAQILTKQMGLTNRFVIPQENLCSCVQKIKNKHDDGADVVVFCFCVLLIAQRICWLCYSITKTKTLGTKKRIS